MRFLRSRNFQKYFYLLQQHHLYINIGEKLKIKVFSLLFDLFVISLYFTKTDFIIF